MPVRKVKGGYKIDNVAGIHKTRASAVRQLQAIKASQARKTTKMSKHPIRKKKRK